MSKKLIWKHKLLKVYKQLYKYLYWNDFRCCWTQSHNRDKVMYNFRCIRGKSSENILIHKSYIDSKYNTMVFKAAPTFNLQKRYMYSSIDLNS